MAGGSAAAAAVSSAASLQLHVADPFDALQWWPRASDTYVQIGTHEERLALCAQLRALQDGSCLACRGRDRVHVHVTAKGTSDESKSCTERCRHEFGDWDYGYLVKRGERLFFLYESGDMESFKIQNINFYELVNIAAVVEQPESQALPPADPSKVVVISHGFSELDGPNYPLIRTLEKVALRLGWKAVVPDFRGTYQFVAARGRSERVKCIYEELLCLEPRPEKIVLVGHSQGGAASAAACTPRVVSAAQVIGLLLIGSENPLSLDGMDWVPPVRHKQLIHGVGDKVININCIRRVANAWDVPLMELESNVRAGALDCWGDDINHDFLAKDLMESVSYLFEDFLEKCGQQC